MLLELKNLEKEAENLLTAIRKVLDLTAPTVPQNVAGQDSGSTVTISWDEAVGAPDISHYKIYRDSVFLSTDDNSPYEDSSLANGTYSYQVTSVDRLGRESGLSTAVQVLVSVVPPHPDVPILFQASATSATGINLSWQRGPIDPAPTDYDLDYSTDSSAGPWTNIPAVGLQTSFSHTALTTATQYWYRLLALNAGTPAPAYIQTTETTDSPAQVGAANFIIGTGVSSWDGSVARLTEQGVVRTVQAGDIIELAAGTHVPLTIQNVIGTANNRITIRGPSTGVATIRRTNVANQGTVFGLNNCRHVNLDGQSTTASPGIDGKRRNIKITYATNASSGSKDMPSYFLKFGNTVTSSYTMTRNITVRYIEVDGGYPTFSNLGAAINTNDNQLKVADYPAGTWQEDMTIEHCYLHDVFGDGMYVGPNTYHTINGEGQTIPLRYIKVRHNYVSDCGNDAVNVKSVYGGSNGADGATENSVHHNVLLRCGFRVGANGTTGIGFSSAKCDIFNNWIEGCAGAGINAQVDRGTTSGNPGPGLTFTSRIYNNVCINNASGDTNKDGIQVNSHTTITAASGSRQLGQVFNNTVILNSGNGIGLRPQAHSDSWARNNISVSNTGTNISVSSGSKSSNQETGQASFLLVDVVGSYEDENLNLRLLVENAASGSIGTDIAATDYADATRSGTTSKGAYEFA